MNKLAKMFGANTVTVGTSGDTDGMIGVVVGGAGTTGNAQIAINGQALCAFDFRADGIGDFVTISSTTAGDCHDSGTKVRSGLTSQIIGQVVNTTASGGNYAVALNLNGVGRRQRHGRTRNDKLRCNLDKPHNHRHRSFV